MTVGNGDQQSMKETDEVKADARGGGDGDKADSEKMPHLTDSAPPPKEAPKTSLKQAPTAEEKPPRPKSFGVLKPEEEALIKLCQEGRLDEVRTLLSKHKKIKLDCLDDSGTTPLEHACYKGHKELVEVLLGAGADVNNNMQTQGYTPLMFAALAGKQDVVRILLRHGARTGATNNIGRTASQLAGFVGHHAVAITISNFFTVEDLNYYTVPNGLEKEPKLPPAIAPLVHRFIMQNNLHPVKILYFIRDNPVIEEESAKILRTFDTIIDKEMKSREMNEIMAMKIHYFSCVLRHAKKMAADGKSYDDMVKLFVRARDAAGFPEYLEKFLRESIRSFPFYQTPLHTTMVHAIAKANLGGSGGSLSILEQSINGQHMAGRDGPPCETCADPAARSKCAGCHMVACCDLSCQKLHWPVHKKECAELALQFVQMERRRLEEEERNRLEEEEKKRKAAQETAAKSEDSAEQKKDEDGQDLKKGDGQDVVNMSDSAGVEQGNGDGEQELVKVPEPAVVEQVSPELVKPEDVHVDIPSQAPEQPAEEEPETQDDAAPLVPKSRKGKKNRRK